MTLDAAAGKPLRRVRRRRAATGATWLRSHASAALVVAAVALPLLLIGGQRGAPLLASCAVALLAGAVSYREGASVPRAAWFFWGLAAYCLFQAVPLPLSWLGRLSPSAGEIWERSLRPFGAVPAWGAISVDPGASLVEGAKWAAYGYLLVGAAAVRARRGGSWLASVVFVSAVFVALTTLAHGLFDARAIFGLYEPLFRVERWSRGPLLNSNNLAGYLNLGLFAGLGAWWSPRRPLPRWFFLAGSAPLLIALVLSGSRAGLLALVAGALLFGGWVALSRRAELSGQLGLASLLGLLAVAVITLLADDRVYRAIVSTDIARKASVWRDALPMIADYWAVGSGRGSFESAFSSYHRPGPGEYALVFTHAESFPIQLLSEWGILVGGAALAVVVGALIAVARRRAREPAAVALCVGLGVLLLQNLADLGLEIPALVVAAVLVGVAAMPSATRLGAPRSLPRVALWVLPGLTAACAAATSAFHTVQDDREALRRRVATLQEQSADVAAVRRDLEAAARRHPAEPYFPFLAGLAAYRLRDTDPLPALARALERSPYRGANHLLLAQVMARRGARSQALLHLRLAALYDRTAAPSAVARALRWAKSGGELVSMLPPEPAIVSEACRKLPAGEASLACWEKFTELSPEDISGTEALAHAWLELMVRNGVPCSTERARCERAVRDAAKLLREQGAAGMEKAILVEARLSSALGDKHGALAKLTKECPHTQSALPCHELAIRLALETRSSELVVQSVHRWLPLACGGLENCSAVQSRAGRWLAEAGAWGLALRAFTDAARGVPTVSHWLDVAHAALQSKNSATAKVALARARSFQVTSEDERRRLAEIEARLLSVP